MRLLCGVLAGAPFKSVLTGDRSLSSRPMERVAEPLRYMGASIDTTDAHAPITVEGGSLLGIGYETPVPSAQVKGAVLLAGTAAEGDTFFAEPVPTRDHTERALTYLGAPVTLSVDGTTVGVSRFQHGGFRGSVPGDPSSAAFLVAGAALTGAELTICDVGLNPSRLRFLEVMGRMGVRTQTRVLGEEVGEPVGELRVEPSGQILPVRVEADELPLVIDEVAVLGLLAAHARAESRFVGAGELRNKESDRLSGVVRGILDLGGHAAVEEDDLVVAGGGLAGGSAKAGGDHRIAMALAIAALAAAAPSEVEGMECAEVSFPGFVRLMAALGAKIEVIA
jgi:3-phosphoshikimate 1-carboxyvinyltransferase